MGKTYHVHNSEGHLRDLSRENPVLGKTQISSSGHRDSLSRDSEVGLQLKQFNLPEDQWSCKRSPDILA